MSSTLLLLLLLLLQPNGKKCCRQGNLGQNRLIMVNRQGEAKKEKGMARNGQQGLDKHFFGMPVRIGCQP